MARQIRQAIAYSENIQRSRALDAARLVNMYAEQPPGGSRAPGYHDSPLQGSIKGVLYGTPGLTLSQTLGTGRARAGRSALGYLWVLFGQTLYRIDSTGTTTACVGDTISPAGTAMLSDNGVQIVILSNGNTYTVGSVNATGSFTVSAGSSLAGTNQITSVVVDGVTVTNGAIDWQDSNAAVAAAIAASINAKTSSPDYTASTNGETVIVKASTSGTGPNGLGIVINVTGDVAVTPPSTSLSGGAATSTTVTQVTSADYPSAGASSIDYVDGYTVFTTTGTTRQWFISQLYDASSISALDFATAESTPGPLLRVIVCNREIWLFSTTGISVWANAGTSPFPFQRIPGATLEKGCAAALSPAELDNTVFWLGADLIVYSASGYSPQRISNHGIEETLRYAATNSTVSDAYGMAYTMGGHHFYVLTFPTFDRTLVYDVTAQSWHERQSETSIIPQGWHVRWLCTAFGKVYAGLDGGQLCTLDLDTYTDTGNAIRRVMVSNPLYGDGKRASISSLEFECELGVGISTGQGSIPTVTMRMSTDGGMTWGNQRTAPLGPMGSRRARAIFRRLGIFRQAAFEFSISDPIKATSFGMAYTPVPAMA